MFALRVCNQISSCSIGLWGMLSRPHHPHSYDTPLASSVQDSDVQDCGVGVEVSQLPATSLNSALPLSLL